MEMFETDEPVSSGGRFAPGGLANKPIPMLVYR
jgi:hypothetical protein